MPSKSLAVQEQAALRKLARLLDKVHAHGLASLDDGELHELPHLYRYGASRLALHETSGSNPAALAAIRELVTRAHAILHRDLDRPRSTRLARALNFLLAEVPATIRREWRMLAASFVLLYGLALVSFVAVASELELAYSLLDPEMVTAEIQQLERTEHGAPFRGNFTFGVGDSSKTSGWIMANNMTVGIVFFAAGLLPPLFVLLLAKNGLMVGTYTAVAFHWDQAGAISSILWCHGVLEIQALVLAGAAGLVLVRAWIAPGPWSRRHAMQLESARAWRLIAPVFPMLFLAGLIEGFISPLAPLGVRLAVAGLSAVLIVAWIALGGRVRRDAVAQT